MRILVTGGAGFIGSHLVERFQGRAEVCVLDNLRTGFRRNLDGLAHEFFEGSIEDEDLLRRVTRGVDYVFHLAAMVSVPESVARPEECARTNAGGTRLVLQAALNAGARKVVFASSAAVYGNNPATPKREDMTPEPQSPYAATKLAGERHCEEFAEHLGLETASLRFFNVFGPRQNPAGAYAAAVPALIDKALRGEPLTIFGDGGQTRDFIDVRDIAGALEFAASRRGVRGVFNCGYGHAISIRELAEKIRTLARSVSPLVFAPERVGDVRHSLADVGKLRAAGWQPQGSLEGGLARTVEFFRKNTPGARG